MATSGKLSQVYASCRRPKRLCGWGVETKTKHICVAICLGSILPGCACYFCYWFSEEFSKFDYYFSQLLVTFLGTISGFGRVSGRFGTHPDTIFAASWTQESCLERVCLQLGAKTDTAWGHVGLQGRTRFDFAGSFLPTSFSKKSRRELLMVLGFPLESGCLLKPR